MNQSSTSNTAFSEKNGLRQKAALRLDQSAKRLLAGTLQLGRPDQTVYQRKICQIIALFSSAVSLNYALVLWLGFDSLYGGLFDGFFCLAHLGAFFWIHRGIYTAAAYWTLLLVAIQVTFGVVLFVGPETGFQYYLLCLPAIVYLLLSQEPPWRKLGLIAIGFAMLIISETVSVPEYRVTFSKFGSNVAYYANLTFVVALNYLALKFFADEATSAYQEQQRLVLSDSLTGLSNRRFVMQYATRLITFCQRYKHPMSLIMLDIDHFKDVNDHYGHQVGDQALKWVASCLKNSLRDADIASRYGGEEFLILLPETDLAEAGKIAESLRVAIASPSNIKALKSRGITASFGVTCLPLDNDTHIEALIQQADTALYLAKDLGRNQVQLFQ